MYGLLREHGQIAQTFKGGSRVWHLAQAESYSKEAQQASNICERCPRRQCQSAAAERGVLRQEPDHSSSAHRQGVSLRLSLSLIPPTSSPIPCPRVFAAAFDQSRAGGNTSSLLMARNCLQTTQVGDHRAAYTLPFICKLPVLTNRSFPTKPCIQARIYERKVHIQPYHV